MVCRLCLQNSPEVLEIFNNKGQELKIAMVIGKHFWFEPKNEDPVSSHICHCCWTKVSDFHEFYKYIEKAQQLLTVEVLVKTEYKLTACDITVEDVQLASIHELEENIEQQYKEPFNITPSSLADDLQDQSIEKDEQSEVCKKHKAFRRSLYSHKHRVQKSDGKFVCNICKESYKMAKSLKEHMLKHTGRSLYRCPHCSRTFNFIRHMERHRKQKHPKEYEEFRKLIKISSHGKDIIIPTISSLSDAGKNTGDLSSEHELEENIDQQYEEPVNITSDLLAEDNYGVTELKTPHYFEIQSIGIVNNEKKKDNQDISAIHNDKEDDLQFQIKGKKRILRQKGTKPKRFSKRNKLKSLTERATTTFKGRGRPSKGEVGHFKHKFNCNEEKAANLRIYNGPRRSNVTTEEISEHLQLKCDVCGIEVNTFGDIKKHMRSVHDVHPYVKCCEKKFFAAHFLYVHIKFHLNPDIYKCEKCDKVFSDKQCLRSHNLHKHQSEDTKIFQCPQCPKKFPKKHMLHLHTHRTYHHDEALKYSCPECKKRFFYMSALTSHTVLKHGTKCDICSEVVKGQVAFKRHLLEHQRKDKLSLTRHNDVKFVCNICKKSYTRATSLKEHMSTHTGLSLRRCPHCSRTFNYYSHMFKHCKVMHPKEEEFRKLGKISARTKEPKIPIISSLSDATKNSGG